MKTIIVATLALLVVACGGGPAPAADESKTAAQLTKEVQTAETPALDQAVTQYKQAIASLEKQSGDIESQIKELGGKALDGLLGGEGKTEEAGKEAGSDLEALKAQVEQILAQLEDMQAKLQIYVNEVASRA